MLKDNWSIESVHSMLDWDFDEGLSHIHTGHGPENMTYLRRFANIYSDFSFMSFDRPQRCQIS